MVKQVMSDKTGKIYSYEDNVPDDLIVQDIEKLEADAPWGKVLEQVGPEIKRGLALGVAGAAEAAGDLFGFDTDGKRVREFITKERQEQLPQNMTTLQEGVLGGLSSVPEMGVSAAAGLGTTLLTGNPALGLAVGIGIPTINETLRAYGEQRGGGMEPGRATFHAVNSGIGEALGELAPMGTIVKKLGKVGFEKFLSEWIGKEFTGEQLTTAWQDLNEKLSIRPDMTFGDYLHDAAVTGVATAVGGGVMAPPLAALNKVLGPSKSPEITSDNSREKEKSQPNQKPPTVEASTPSIAPTVEAGAQTQDFPAPLTDADAIRPELNTLIQQVEEAMNAGNIPAEPISETEETPAQAKTFSPLAPQLEGLEEKHLRDVGATPEVYNNPHNYKDPNTATPILDRFITRVKAANQQLSAKAGIRFGDLQASDFDTSAGPVVLQVGKDSDVRPANYMRGLLEDLYDLAAEFNPQGIYVLLPEDLAVRGDPLGTQGGHFTENGIHYIIPRHLTNITEQGSHWTRPGENQYSSYAKLDAWSTLQHEFGHSLIHDFFFSGLTQEERMLFELGLKQDKPIVAPELFAKLDPGAQALLQKWLTFRADVNNNRISGREAAARWLSPAKLQKKATFTKPGISWDGSDWSARNLRDALNTYDDRLSLDEFLAEQMPKYMYQRGLAGSKMLEAVYGGKFDASKTEAFVESNIAAFFRPLIDLLQKVFNTMQIKGMIGPEKEFTDWVEGLSRRGREAVKGKQGEGKATPEPYQEERIDWSVPSRYNKLKSALSSLVRSRVLNGNSKQYKELKKHLIMEEWEEFLDKIEPLLGEKLKFDLDSWETADVKGWTPVWLAGHGTTAVWKTSSAHPQGRIDMKKVLTGEATIWQGFGFYLGEAIKTFRHYASYKPRADTPFDYVRNDGHRYTFDQMVDQVAAVGRRTPGIKQMLETIYPDDPLLRELTLQNIAAHVSSEVYATEYYRQLPNSTERKKMLDAEIDRVMNALKDLPKVVDKIVPSDLIPMIRKRFTFKIKQGQNAVKQFEILRPLEHFLYWDWGLDQQSDYVKEALNKLKPEYQAAFHRRSSESDQTPLTAGNFYWRLAEIKQQELGPAHIKNLQNRGIYGVLEDVRAAKLATDVLRSVGIAGNAYLNHDARGNRPNPPRQGSGDWNIVLFNAQDGRALTTVTVPGQRGFRGFNLREDALGQAKARMAWKQKQTESEAFQRWFEGSVVVDGLGRPMPVYYARGTDLKIGDRPISIMFSDFLSTTWLAGVIKEQPHNRKIIQSYLNFKPEKVVTIDLPSNEELSPQKFIQALQPYVRRQDIDGIVITGGNQRDFRGKMFIPLRPDTVAVDPEPPAPSATLRFDISDPEEAMYANKWQTLRDKLSLSILGESISRLHRAKYVFLQTSQLAHLHPEWNWFTEFRQTASKFYRRTAELHSRADAAIREINRTLGKEALAKLDKFTTDEFRGGEHWTDIKEEVDAQGRKYTVHVPGEKLLAKLRKYGFDPDTLRGKKFASAYLAAKNALAYQMDEFEQMLINIRWQKYRAHQNPLVMQQKIAEVIKTFKVLRAQPFWPQMTFGRYLVRVTKREGNHSYVVYEFGTESIKEWEREEQKVRAKYKKEQGFEIHSEDQKASTNESAILMRLPVEFLDDLAVALGLDNSQLDPVLDADRIQENKAKLSQIRDLMQSLYEKSPTKTYDPMKRLIEGGSTDFVEKFASFALTTSNFIAKAEYRKLFDNTLQTAKAVSSALPAGREKAEIEVGRGFLQDTLHYIMDPQEEMHRARAFVAVTYLAGNLATALMNFQGLSFTWAYLNRELGYFKGTKEFFKSMGSSSRTLLKEFKDQAAAMLAGAGDQAILSITDPNWEMVNGKPTELRRALEQAKEENVLDQSYAYYLAGHASRGSLARMTKYAWGRMAKGAIDISMAPFRAGELVIRRATFIAVYRTLELTQPGLTPQQRYNKATEMTLQLQGDYTKGNRPRFMRGKLASLMFVFYTFPLNAAWQTYGGLELGLRRQEKLAGRATPAFYRNHGVQLTLLLLAMAGLEGLPFAENLFDVIDMIWKRWIEPGKSARTALREILKEFTDHPQRFVHGVAYDVGGFDLSRRIGLGRIIPGTEHLVENFTPAYEKIGKVGTSLFGVPGGYLDWMVDTFERVNQASEFGGVDKGVEELGHQMGRLPGGIGNIVKAFEWARYDARDHLGGLIAWDEETGRGRPTYWWENVGKGIGFNPTAVSEHQAIRAAQNDAIDYWQERKKWVLNNYFTAHEITKDREAIADATRDLIDFQQKVPFPSMRIKNLQASMIARRRQMESSTNLVPIYKSYQPLAREIEESF